MAAGWPLGSRQALGDNRPSARASGLESVAPWRPGDDATTKRVCASISYAPVHVDDRPNNKHNQQQSVSVGRSGGLYGRGRRKRTVLNYSWRVGHRKKTSTAVQNYSERQSLMLQRRTMQCRLWPWGYSTIARRQLGACPVLMEFSMRESANRH
jgi:hypothetical protein